MIKVGIGENHSGRSVLDGCLDLWNGSAPIFFCSEEIMFEDNEVFSRDCKSTCKANHDFISLVS